MAPVFDYYKLASPDEGVANGFVCRTVPHLTLKSIANNPEIREGMTRDEIAVAIAKFAEQEVLYDQPEVDRSKVRVTGPFTVEAVPAPAVRPITEIVVESQPVDLEEQPALPGIGSLEDQSKLQFTENVSVARYGETLRQRQWRDELLACGIRAKGGQRIEFARLEPLGGTRWLQSEGETKGSKPERVVVSFGPEHAPLEQRQVSMALDEAQQLRPTPTMIIFATFQFDPEAAKDSAPQSPRVPPHRPDPVPTAGNSTEARRFLTTVPDRDLVVDRAIAARAKSTITWSLIVGGVAGVLFGLIPLTAVASEAGGAALIACPGFFLLGAYAGWATFMGWKVVWQWWKNLFGNQLALATSLVAVCCFFYVFITAASWYGEFGGGLWQLVNHWQLATGRRVLIYGKPVRGWQCVVASMALVVVLAIILAAGSAGLAANRPSVPNRATQPGMSQHEPGTGNPSAPSPSGGRRPRR